MARTPRTQQQIRQGAQVLRRTCCQPSQGRLETRINAIRRHQDPGPQITVLEPALVQSMTPGPIRFPNARLTLSRVGLTCPFPLTIRPIVLISLEGMSGATVKSHGTRALEIHAIPGNPVMLGTSESPESLVNHGSSVIPGPLILPVPTVRATFLTDEDKIMAGNHLDLTDQRAAVKVSGSGLGMLRAVEAKTTAA